MGGITAQGGEASATLARRSWHQPLSCCGRRRHRDPPAPCFGPSDWPASDAPPNPKMTKYGTRQALSFSGVLASHSGARTSLARLQGLVSQSFLSSRSTTAPKPLRSQHASPSAIRVNSRLPLRGRLVHFTGVPGDHGNDISRALRVVKAGHPPGSFLPATTPVCDPDRGKPCDRLSRVRTVSFPQCLLPEVTELLDNPRITHDSHRIVLARHRVPDARQPWMGTQCMR